MNNLTKESISLALIKAQQDEKLMNQDVADIFGISTYYVTTIRTQKRFEDVPEYVWTMLNAWRHSGKPLKGYKPANSPKADLSNLPDMQPSGDNLPIDLIDMSKVEINTDLTNIATAETKIETIMKTLDPKVKSFEVKKTPKLRPNGFPTPKNKTTAAEPEVKPEAAMSHKAVRKSLMKKKVKGQAKGTKDKSGQLPEKTDTKDKIARAFYQTWNGLHPLLKQNLCQWGLKGELYDAVRAASGCDKISVMNVVDPLLLKEKNLLKRDAESLKVPLQAEILNKKIVLDLEIRVSVKGKEKKNLEIPN